MSNSEGALVRWREEFPILDRCVYLVSHSLGAMPRGVRQGLEEYAWEWERRGVRAWAEGWWELPVTAGDSIAEFLRAPAGSISMQPNVTLATALFLSACDFSGIRNRIVTDALHFPSLLYLFEGMAAAGAEVVTVPSEDGITIDPGRLCEAIDERTRVVAISHVLFRSSFVQELEPLTRHAREVGALVLLDVYQSAGVFPLDLAGSGLDAAVGGCLKWLCGGPGAAFLYVRPDLAGRLAPRITGWQSHRDPFAFAEPPLERAGGSWRFLHGTPAIPALKAAQAGMEIVSKVGIEAIREKSVRQTGLILDRARREGWPARTPLDPARRGGVVTVDPPHAYEVSRALLEQNIIIDYRAGAGIRFGPHFYNTDGEVAGALDAISEILDGGSWRRFEGAPREHVT